MAAVEGLADFGVVVTFAVAFALSLLAYLLAEAIATTLDVRIPIIGVRPFHGISAALKGSIVKWLATAVRDTEKGMVWGLNGLIDSLAVMLSVFALLGYGVWLAIKWLWDTGTPAAILNKTEPIRRTADNAQSTANSAASTASSAARTAGQAIGTAENAAQGYASTAEANAKAAARGYTDSQVSALRSAMLDEIASVEGDIRAGTATAQRYADTAVADLRRQENEAISAAEGRGQAAITQARTDLAASLAGVQTAAEASLTSTALALGDALNSGIGAVYAALAAAVAMLQQAIQAASAASDAALSTAEGALTQAVRDAETASATALTAAETVISTAIGQEARDAATALSGAVDTLNADITKLRATAQATAAELATAEGAVAVELPQIPSLDWDALRRRLNGQDLATLGGLLASVPLLRALTNSLADEAGLGKAECRGKVKNICGTDPLKWAGLLAGIAAIGAGFNLTDIVEAAGGAVGEAHGLLADVANVSEDAIRDAGRAIGEVAAAIAA